MTKLFLFVYCLFGLLHQNRSQTVVLQNLQDEAIQLDIRKTKFKLVILFDNLYCGTCLEQINQLIKQHNSFASTAIFILNNNKNQSVITYKNIANKYLFHQTKPSLFFINKTELLKLVPTFQTNSPSLLLIKNGKLSYKPYSVLFDSKMKLKVKNIF
ncbi:MAG: hypothetical protein V4538_09575 [Bacteroidota bacterium]